MLSSKMNEKLLYFIIVILPEDATSLELGIRKLKSSRVTPE
jgi:hypothetical protein